MSRNRAGVKRRLVEIADHVLQHDDVSVSYTWDGSAVSDNTLFLGVTTGAEELEAVGAATHRRNDTFTIEGELRMFGFLTGEDAEAAAEEVFTKLDEALRVSPRLLDVPDLDNTNIEDYLRVRVQVGQVDGPAHSFPGPQGGNTVEGWVLFSIDCVTDL